MSAERQRPEPGDVLDGTLLVIDFNTYAVLDHERGIKQGDGRMIVLMEGGVEIKQSLAGGDNAIDFAPKLARALRLHGRPVQQLQAPSGD